MYEITNKNFYKLYDLKVNGIVDFFYSDEEFIKFVCNWYRNRNIKDIRLDYSNNLFIRMCTCEKEAFSNRCSYQLGSDKRYIIYDNLNRIININDFKKKIINYYEKNIDYYTGEGYIGWSIAQWLYFHRTSIQKSKNKKAHKVRKNYSYRMTPVPYTRKMRGGPNQRNRKAGRLLKIFKNPEYESYNRDSKKDIFFAMNEYVRTPQKSWKSQSKCRHQWEKKIAY